MLDQMIYNPLDEYDKRLRSAHFDNTNAFFDDLVARSGVDVAANRETVEQYNIYKENLSQLKKKLNLWRFLRVVMCITVVLIPVRSCK